jgi:hypothetical protein
MCVCVCVLYRLLPLSKTLVSSDSTACRGAAGGASITGDGGAAATGGGLVFFYTARKKGGGTRDTANLPPF